LSLEEFQTRIHLAHSQVMRHAKVSLDSCLFRKIPTPHWWVDFEYLLHQFASHFLFFNWISIQSNWILIQLMNWIWLNWNQLSSNYIQCIWIQYACNIIQLELKFSQKSIHFFHQSISWSSPSGGAQQCGAPSVG
jgi:hypothetical protein